MCFRSVDSGYQDKLKWYDGAVGGRKNTKTGEENQEENEFELVSGEFDCKCETPVSLLYFIGEEDITMQKFGFLLDFGLLSRISCSQFSMRNDIIFDESAIYCIRALHFNLALCSSLRSMAKSSNPKELEVDFLFWQTGTFSRTLLLP